MKKKATDITGLHFNIILIHTLIGAIISIFVFHPITMVVYWFEFNPSTISFDSLADVFMMRVKHSFHSSMLPMSIIFALIGGFFGFISGLYSRSLRLKKILSENHEELIELDNIKSNFLHLISHEIRTPLNGIVGFVSIIKNMDTSSELKHIVDMLDASVTRLENFSLTALKITELRTKDTRLNKDRLNLLEEVRFRLSKYNEKILQRQIAVNFSLRLNEGQTFVFADAGLFDTCMDHILANTLQFCKKKISIDGWEDSTKSYTILEIGNDGKGLSGLAEKNVFNLLGSNTTRLVGFNGLDFPLIKLICEAHKGKIEFGNSTDGGAAIRLYFPIVNNLKS